MDTTSFGDQGFSSEPVYLADLGRCRPQEALTQRAKRGCWRVLDYDADVVSGTMLIAGPETAAQQVTYPLDLRGWHAVSIGAYLMPGVTVQLQLKLSDDRAFTMLTLPQAEPDWTVHSAVQEQLREMYWKVADLTGQELVISQISWQVKSGDGPGTTKSVDAAIAYVKAVRLTESEVSAVKEDQGRTDIRRLFAHNDGHGPLYSYRLTTADGIRRHIEPYRDSDFSRIYWEAGGGDLLHYFTKIGHMPTLDSVEDFGRQGDRMHAESWRLFRETGVDPFRVAAEYSHEIGLEFHAGYRVAGFHGPPPLPGWRDEEYFYSAHPELRGVDRFGRVSPRISYTYPETRQFVISVLREIASYPVDGICFMYNRRMPLVEYEHPLVEGYEAEYGEDPRSLNEGDPRWLSHRAGVLTQFMRDVRQAMDEAAAERSHRARIGVSAIVMGSEQENLLNGIDLNAWVGEGLVDTLIPYSSHPSWGSTVESWTDMRDVGYFVSLTRNTSCLLALNIMPRSLPPEAYRLKAAALYDAGVESFFFWDTNPSYAPSWTALRRLGHRQEIESWMQAGQPPLSGSSTPLRRLADWDFVQYGTGE